MFRSHYVAALAAAGIFVLAQPVAAQSPEPVPNASASELPPMRSLRHLVFAYAATATRKNHKVEGDRFDNPSGGLLQESPTYRFADNRDGRLTVDVVAAPADGGLAVDASETSGAHTGAPARIAITFDQALIYRSRDPFSDDAQFLLRFLSRGLIGVADPAAGTTWTVDHHVGNVAQTCSYTILSLDAARHATVSFSIDSTTRGLTQTVSSEKGTVLYDLGLTVPLSVHREAHIMATMGTQTVTEDEVTDAHLISDSFGPAPRPSPTTTARPGS